MKCTCMCVSYAARTARISSIFGLTAFIILNCCLTNKFLVYYFIIHDTCNIKYSSKINKYTLLLLLVWDKTSGDDGYSVGSN